MMRRFQPFLHLLLAIVLVINGLAGVAMATGMAIRPLAADASAPVADHDGCHETQAAIAAGHHTDTASSVEHADCCSDGRCVCACVHHGVLALNVVPAIATMAAWPMLLSRETPAAPSRVVTPALRPPIALIF